MKVVCEVSLGELVDKISILKIKKKKILDNEKNKLVTNEYNILIESLSALKLTDIDSFLLELEMVNTELWEIEDNIREYEKNKNFSQEFVRLARAVYITNDKRFAIKSAINEQYGSLVKEVKSYEDY